jgi:hypothetical protein
MPLDPSSPDDIGSSSSLFALAAGDGERETDPWFLCRSVDCRHFDKAFVSGDPSERVIYLGKTNRQTLEMPFNEPLAKPTYHQPIELPRHPSGIPNRRPERSCSQSFVR